METRNVTRRINKIINIIRVIITPVFILNAIYLYNCEQLIQRQRQIIKDLQSNYYKLNEYEEAIRVADIIFDNNNIWDKDKSEIMNDYINIRCNIDSTFYEGFHNSALLDSISYMYNE